MSLKTVEKKECDVLIIGGGGAGLRASIAAAASGADVLIVSKTRIGYPVFGIQKYEICGGNGLSFSP